jgi:predicted AAA+ superfamily ATPase
VARGGYPEAVRRDVPRRRQRFFSNYVADLMSRDVHQVADIQKSDDLRRLLSLVAAQSGGILNANRLSSSLGISAPTVRTYLDILETVFVVRRIPAYATGATGRATGAPKITLVDSGVATWLTSGLPSSGVDGGLLEGFVLGELGRQLSWSTVDARLLHYRDRDGVEVDGVLEDVAGRVVGIEVKASETLRSEDFAGLRKLQDRLGSRFLAGFVVNCGAQALRVGDRLGCVPICTLWQATADPT